MQKWMWCQVCGAVICQVCKKHVFVPSDGESGYYDECAQAHRGNLSVCACYEDP